MRKTPGKISKKTKQGQASATEWVLCGADIASLPSTSGCCRGIIFMFKECK